MAKGTPALQMPPSLAGEFVWQHLRRHTRHLPHASDHGAKETGPGGRPGRARIGAPGEKEQAPCPSRSRSRRAACTAWGPLPAPPRVRMLIAQTEGGRGRRRTSPSCPCNDPVSTYSMATTTGPGERPSPG